jgi:hypothetical protein
MADEKQVERLKKSVWGLKKWKNENFEVKIDLSESILGTPCLMEQISVEPISIRPNSVVPISGRLSSSGSKRKRHLNKHYWTKNDKP